MNEHVITNCETELLTVEDQEFIVVEEKIFEITEVAEQGPVGLKGDRGEGIDNFHVDLLAYYILAKN